MQVDRNCPYFTKILKFTLQLEICPPSKGKGATDNYFDQYIHLTGRPRLKGEYKSVALESTVDGFSETVDGFSKTVDGFSKTLQDTVGSVVELDAMMKDVSKTKNELDEKEKELVAKQEQLQKDKNKLHKEIQKEEDKLQNELELMAEMDRIHATRIKLDIGGHLFTTTKLTLTKYPESVLGIMFGRQYHMKRDSDGRQKEEDRTNFIDRDGTHFRYILNYLRGNVVSV